MFQKPLLKVYFAPSALSSTSEGIRYPRSPRMLYIPTSMLDEYLEVEISVENVGTVAKGLVKLNSHRQRLGTSRRVLIVRDGQGVRRKEACEVLVLFRWHEKETSCGALPSFSSLLKEGAARSSRRSLLEKMQWWLRVCWAKFSFFVRVCLQRFWRQLTHSAKQWDMYFAGEKRA